MMEIKDVEVSVELADIRGGSVNQSAQNYMSASQTGAVTTVHGTQGDQLVGSPMALTTNVFAPQGIAQSNSPELVFDNRGNVNASDSFSYSSSSSWWTSVFSLVSL